MISPPPLQVPISAPTGGLTAAWIAWFDSLRKIVADQESAGDTGPDAITAVAALSMALASALQELQTLPRQPVDQLSQEIGAVKQELQMLPRPELGTFAALQQANLPWTTFDATPEFTPPDVGTVAWDGGTTLGIQMTANVLQPVGEAQYFYIKADSTITKGQLIMFTGAVGASGVIKGAPATGITDGQYLMGIAAEDIATNGFGLVTSFGHVRGWNTTGAPVGETWVDGDILFYNPSIAGGLTKTQPTAPNVKAAVAVVVNAAPAGSGDVFVRVSTGSVLGGTDSNVQITGLANNDMLVYDSVDGRWENYAPTAARDALGLGTGNPSNGQMLIGNGTDFTTAALTAGTGIEVTNGAGSATIATNLAAGSNISITGTAPQTIATTGASGSFLSADTPALTVTVSNGIITSIV